MKANLSLVLDKDGYVRLDLLKDIELSEIDKYTCSLDSSKEIKEENSNEIECFLDENLAYVQTFKRDQDKKGRIVIIYEDEKHKLHNLRVLYKDNIKKLNSEEMIGNIRSTLEKEESFNKTLDVINHFSGFIFGSEFDRKEIRRLKTKLSLGNVSEKLCNKTLVKNIVYNHLVLTLSRNKEKAYFHIRLIDSYMEKNKLYTTKNEKTARVNNLKVNKLEEKAKVVKKKLGDVVKDGNFFLESNGQYNLFDNNGLTSSGPIVSYEDYLDREEERRLNK